MTGNHFWYAPVPPDFGSSRVTLHFGLRSDDIYYRNLVVPQAGRVWFVRELSWCVGALVLAHELAKEFDRPPGAVAVAHALEAVGCKLAWWHERNGERAPGGPRRVTGRRAFERDFDSDDRWAFSELTRPENYVVNTHRQAVVGALRVGAGLGLVAERRFASMVPIGLGRELARAFLDQPVGRGRGRLESRLIEWIRASDVDTEEEFLDHESGFRALASTTASDAERLVVRRMLFEGGHESAHKRRALRDVFAKDPAFPDIDEVLVSGLQRAGHAAQANEIRAARAFGAVLDAVVDMAFATHAAMGATSAQRPADALVRDDRVGSAVEALGARLQSHVELARVANTLVHATASARLLMELRTASPAERLLRVLRRGERLFEVERSMVSAGPLFDRLDRTRAPSPGDDLGEAHAADAEGDPDDVPNDTFTSERSFYLEGFHQLVSDCMSSEAGVA